MKAAGFLAEQSKVLVFIFGKLKRCHSYCLPFALSCLLAVEQKEVNPDSIRFQPPNIELQGNASAFSIYATVREYVLERDMLERELILIRANSAASKSEEAGANPEETAKPEDALKLPKVTGPLQTFATRNKSGRSDKQDCLSTLRATSEVGWTV